VEVHIDNRKGGITMATRKPKTTELSAAARDLTAAAVHLRQAVNEKIEAFEKSAARDLDKARRMALSAGGEASRQFDALLTKAQKQLTKATTSAKKALHSAVTKSEKQLLALDKALQSALAKFEQVGAAKTVTRKAVAKKAPAKKAPAKKAPTKKAVAKKAPVKAKAPARRRSS
jgi:hypothetical protein